MKTLSLILAIALSFAFAGKGNNKAYKQMNDPNFIEQVKRMNEENKDLSKKELRKKEIKKNRHECIFKCVNGVEGYYIKGTNKLAPQNSAEGSLCWRKEFVSTCGK